MGSTAKVDAEMPTAATSATKAAATSVVTRATATDERTLPWVDGGFLPPSRRPRNSGLYARYDRAVSLELGRLSDRKPPFKFSALDRVGFSDTDAQGIVYYGRYLPYFDAARVEYLRELGIEYSEGKRETRARVRHAGPHHRIPRAGRVRRPRRGFCPPLAGIGRTSATFEFAAYRAPPTTCSW